MALAPRREHHALTQFRILLTLDKDEVILWIGCWDAKNIAVYFSTAGRGFVSPNNADRAFKKLRTMNRLRLIRGWRCIMTAEQSKQELNRSWGTSRVQSNIPPSSNFYLTEDVHRFPPDYALGYSSSMRRRRIWLMLDTS
ncbi:hypothetical protein LTR70_008311 [Exophiala xenobiotica]|uniref:Uncharacterized protein n=1 Tax=Lithohypha guttulata TaxID=1690604 RepID=A0ABR0K1L3_9EURO|nr:hypothetical protein LTR24_007889 [Lithohypha guttulata]KAK5312214.1 hypothetical protein LTR70_008311 [Exophiala xenobiotica]